MSKFKKNCKKYRFQAFFLLIATFGLFVLSGFPQVSANGPTEVSSWTELNAIRNNPDLDYILINNLTPLDDDYEDIIGDGTLFLPIGDFDNPFIGTFDGQGFTIEGLHINQPGMDYVGLFGIIDSDAEISNLGLVDVNINGDEFVGGLVGYNKDGLITNSYSTGEVTGSMDVGGLVGRNDDSITNSYATGSVSGGNDVGGLVGENYGSITNSYATGSVSGNDGVGGLAGYEYLGSITNCGWYNHEGNPDYPIGSDPMEELTYNETDNTVFYSKFHNLYDTNEPYWDFTTPIWYEWINDYPKLHEQISVSISSWTGLNTVRNNLARNYILINNLTPLDDDYEAIIGNGTLFLPIGDSTTKFTGTFNGQGFTIEGLHINQPAMDYVGLFGYTGGDAEISNLGLIDVDIIGKNRVGGLAGRSDGSITNSYATGSVNGNDVIGGLVGDHGGSVTNSYATGSVDGDRDVGGLVGKNWDLITNSYATGNVKGSMSGDVGGLVGWNGGSITNSYATGSVEGDASVGGFVGQNDGSITNSYSTGSVSGLDAGGFVGYDEEEYGTITNSGWLNHAGNPAKAIGYSKGDITYEETVASAFYPRTHGVYREGELDEWEQPPWYWWTNTYPLFEEQQPTYTLTYTAGPNGSIDGISPQTVDHGEDGTTVEAVPAEGHHFVKWSDDSTDNPRTDTNVTDDITVTAEFAINSYDLIFKDYDESILQTTSYEYNADLSEHIPPADPTRTGYTFTGWDILVPDHMPADDVVIVAQYSINQYTITFDSDGGTAVDPITQDYETAVSAPEDPTKIGYTFDGWDPELPATMPEEGSSHTAQWTARGGSSRPSVYYSVSITAKPLDGGRVPQGGTYSDRTSMTISATPNEGYEFLYWEENGEIITKNQLYSFAVNNDRILIAVFEKEEDSTDREVDTEEEDYKEETESDVKKKLEERIKELQKELEILLEKINRENEETKEEVIILDEEFSSCNKFNNDLSFGLRLNDEVRCLQLFLKAQGPEIYPEGLITGNYLELTRDAVTRFQEKYFNEILAPLNLIQGTGYLGLFTRAKVNSMVF